MTVQWFGDPWPSPSDPAPICEDPHDRVPTPVGQLCAVCDGPILPPDSGIITSHPATGRSEPAPCHRWCIPRLFGLEHHGDDTTAQYLGSL